jgi:nucleoid-associated protein YgaU
VTPGADVNTVVLSTAQPQASVSALLGAANPVPTSGYATWEIIDRPRRVSMTNFTGRQPYQMDLPVVLSKFREHGSIEKAMSTLEMMARPLDSLHGPPVVTVAGPKVPHRNLKWVINGIDWGATEYSFDHRYRMRQEGTLHLLEHVPVTVVKERNVSPGTRNYKWYIVKHSDGSLKTIAMKLLGSAKRWKDIGKLNGIRDPKNIHPGEKLKVPKS